ncbi:double-strand-break repair protein rad21-like protein 1 [Discoglossus pictus]
MFYAHLLLNKRGPLAKIWLAAHWEKKLTKAHIYECNLETTIQSIISPKVTIALRTSGHLLLGVVRIYHRKAKYLLADCNEAFIKMKMAFRPGAVDLTEDDQEARYNAITLPEEFHEFDLQLPDLNTIDVVDHFTLNQSRLEDITLREDISREYMLHGAFGMDSKSFSPSDWEGDDIEITRRDSPFDGSFEMSTNTSLFPELSSATLSQEKKGMEDPTLEHPTLEHPTPEHPEESNAANDEVTLISANEEEGFVLQPVEITASVEKKKSKKKRNLIVDEEKELTSSVIRQQLGDFRDTLAAVDIAPPTRKLMDWKQKGGVEWLLSNPAQPLISAELLLVFTHCVMLHDQRTDSIHQAVADIETMRQEQEVIDLPLLEEPSVFQESRLTDASSLCVEDPVPNQTVENRTAESESSTLLQGFADLSDISIPSKEGRYTEENLETVVGTQDTEERKWNKRTQEILNHLRNLNESGISSFSLLKLCKNDYRKKASAKFYSFLVLKNKSAIKLSQRGPYWDIIATPGPRFHSM